MTNYPAIASSTELRTALLKRGLPKWPQMYVTGVPVTLAQAKEVIRRTDRFFSSIRGGGNNHNFDLNLKSFLQIPHYEARYWSEYNPLRESEFDAWQLAWGFIDTEYVANDWISCSFIGGPHGWMHPDGQIGFGDNIGKWPSVEAVLADWERLASAFPFLDLAVTLMDREDCEDNASPVVSLLVHAGTVTLAEPDPVHHALHPNPVRGNVMDGLDEQTAVAFRFGRPSSEQGLPTSWFDEWAQRPALLR